MTADKLRIFLRFLFALVIALTLPMPAHAQEEGVDCQEGNNSYNKSVSEASMEALVDRVAFSDSLDFEEALASLKQAIQNDGHEITKDHLLICIASKRKALTRFILQKLDGPTADDFDYKVHYRSKNNDAICIVGKYDAAIPRGKSFRLCVELVGIGRKKLVDQASFTNDAVYRLTIDTDASDTSLQWETFSLSQPGYTALMMNYRNLQEKINGKQKALDDTTAKMQTIRINLATVRDSLIKTDSLKQKAEKSLKTEGNIVWKLAPPLAIVALGGLGTSKLLKTDETYSQFLKGDKTYTDYENQKRQGRALTYSSATFAATWYFGQGFFDWPRKNRWLWALISAVPSAAVYYVSTK